MRRRRTSKGRFTKGHKSSKRRKSRRRRPNGGGLGRTAFLARMAAGKRKAAKAHAPRKARKGRKRRSTRRKAVSGRRIRPVILVSRSGRYHRPRRSKYFTRPRRVNRRRRNGFGSGIVSTIKRVLTLNSITNYLGIGGGIFIGSMLSRMLNTGVVPFTSALLPASITTTLSGRYVRPFHGFAHIILGTLIASKVRNKYAKDVGIGMAALGGFDLLTQLLSAVGMVGLPTFSGMNVNMLGRSSGRQLSGMNVDFAGMNVNMLGGMNMENQESDQIADSINASLS